MYWRAVLDKLSDAVGYVGPLARGTRRRNIIEQFVMNTGRSRRSSEEKNNKVTTQVGW